MASLRRKIRSDRGLTRNVGGVGGGGGHVHFYSSIVWRRDGFVLSYVYWACTTSSPTLAMVNKPETVFSKYTEMVKVNTLEQIIKRPDSLRTC